MAALRDDANVGVAGAVIVVAAIVALVGLVARLRVRRSDEVAVVAARLGMLYVERDPRDVLALPFRLFRRTAQRRVAHFLIGQRDGHEVLLFDLELGAPSEPPIGEVHPLRLDGSAEDRLELRLPPAQHQNRLYSTHYGIAHRTSCGLMTLPMAAPHLVVVRTGDMTVGPIDDLDAVRFESDEFNRRFTVRCEDERFAFSLIDAAMMELLVQAGGAIETIEFWVGYLLVAFEHLEAREWPLMLKLLVAISTKVPAVVFSSYPPTAAPS